MINEKREWEDIYKKYSLDEIPWHEDEPEKSLVKLLRTKKVETGIALDVCSGAGTNMVYLAKKGFDVTGIDISKTATEIAEKHAENAGVSKSCRFLSGDILKINLPKNKFNFVFDRGCYHHIPKNYKPRFAKIISDSLKKDGVYFLICFSDFNPPWKKNVSKDEIRRNFSPYFKIKNIINVPTREKTGRLLNFYHVMMIKKIK